MAYTPLTVERQIPLGSKTPASAPAPPPPALAFVRTLALKPALRGLRALACEATATRVTLHLSQDTPLDPEKLIKLVSSGKGYQFTPDLRLTRRFGTPQQSDAVELVRRVLQELAPLRLAAK
jgi:transcription-repair coupling factor (superfamily II helicase)